MDAKQTPLIELLRDVPPSARALREVSEYEHHNIPYGRLMNEAADSIDALESQLDAIKSAAAGMIEEIIAALENERKNALAGAEYYAFCKAIDTVRSVQQTVADNATQGACIACGNLISNPDGPHSVYGNENI